MKLITTSDELAEVIAAVSTVDRYALDTEFHRERTYFPQVALIQIGWFEGDEHHIALIDPLAVDVAPLATVLDGDGLCLIHAATQDLEVLDLACGTVPKRMFDTQVAAGFLGVSTGSLATLLQRFCKVEVAKGDRLTDWLKRPLTDRQLAYAATDVEYLHDLHDRIIEGLRQKDRLEWAEEEIEQHRTKTTHRRPPEEAVNRIKEARSLRGNAAGVARSVAAWRERRARDLDVPVRQILPDLGVVAIAQKAPTSVEQLANTRGVDKRHLRAEASAELLSAVAAGKRLAETEPPPKKAPDLPKELRPVITLVSTWIAQLGRDEHLDPTLIGTRSDIEALLSGSDAGRLSSGWRADLVGEPIRRLVDGEAAVAFERGRLVLEPRFTS